MSFSEVQPDARWHEKEEDMVGQWILSRLQKTMASVEKDLDQFRFAAAAGSIYNFFWGEFCDWYVELLKPQLKQATAGEQSRLLGRTQWILDQVLRVLHPFMPFITEELWQHLQGTTGVEPPPRFLMAQPWPTVVDLYDYPEAEACMAAMQQVISASRAVFKAYQLPKNARPTLYLSGDEGLVMNLLEQQHLIQALSGVGALVWREELPEKCSALALSGISGALDIRQWLDIQAELGKIERQLEKLTAERSRLEKRLHNREFLAKAPQDVVEKSQQECAELLRQEQTLQDSKIALGRLI
jgi:valyl-tRNA synthetase